jgi:UDP-N-acetylmuramate dehydrogenase
VTRVEGVIDGVAGAVDIAARLLGARARRDVALAPMTTYRVGGAAALFVDACSLDDLEAVAAARLASGLPVLVVGRGSNLLVADDGFAGIAVSVTGFGDLLSIGDVGAGGDVIVAAGGGASLPVLARRTAAAGITGFEWAVGVPGSIGGAVRMNAGGHGADMAGCLLDADVVSLDAPSPQQAVVRRVPAAALGLRFRGSDLGDADVVVGGRLALRVGDRQESEERIAEIVRWRREHQPGGQNCGSVFVNPVPGALSAGALIDGLGLRGLRVGSAHVSEKHANFIQASEGGTAADVRALIEVVRDRVASSTGIVLRSEVRLVGFAGEPTRHEAMAAETST